MDQQTTTVEDYSPVWEQRFDFFDTYGPQSSSPQARRAFRALPALERFRIGSNIVAFVFGALYFFAKGMWRKGLTMVMVTVAVQVVAGLLDAPGQLQYLLGYAVSGGAMTTANYAYYLHGTEGSTSWNPCQGLGRR